MRGGLAKCITGFVPVAMPRDEHPHARLNRLNGLSIKEARRRLREYGFNRVGVQSTSALGIAGRQFKGGLSWLMVLAAIVSWLLGQRGDALLITGIAVFNLVLGFVQEYRSERALTALQVRGAPRVIVRRDGEDFEISSLQVVLGDLLVLAPGTAVAADAELLEANDLRVSEHDLTGESRPVSKHVVEDVRPGGSRERHDCVFGGTVVDSGFGLARVFATGANAAIARLARLAKAVHRQATPLEQHLEEVGRKLLLGCTAIILFVALTDRLSGRAWPDVFLSGISLAIAALPEGLPAIVTLGLSRGAHHMERRHVLVRKLDAVENLASTTVICTGKNLVLTTGELQVRAVWGEHPEQVLRAAALSLDGVSEMHSPTTREHAILKEAGRRGVSRDEIIRIRNETGARRSRRNGIDCLLGAEGPSYMLGDLSLLKASGIDASIEATERAEALRAQGHDVLAVASFRTKPERDGALLGLIGLSEPPRVGIAEALERARAAGIRVLMLTGDEPRTARALALEVGVLQPQDEPDEVVIAGATPEHKLHVVEQLRRSGHVVAMTAESTNNAPALREADVAFSLRESSEITRAASELVLLDDDFAHVMSAIQQGRGIYANIQKAIVYLLAGNLAEIGVMAIASLFGLPVPLLPVQLLWLNMITDGPPALALVLDPVGDEVMKGAPRGRAEHLLGRRQWATIVWVGTLQTIVCLTAFVWALHQGGVQHARNSVFLLLTFVEVLWALSARDAATPFWEFGSRRSVGLLTVVLGCIAAQWLVPRLSFGPVLFGGRLPSKGELLGSLALGLGVLLLLEGSKPLLRVLQRRKEIRALRGAASSALRHPPCG